MDFEIITHHLSLQSHLWCVFFLPCLSKWPCVPFMKLVGVSINFNSLITTFLAGQINMATLTEVPAALDMKEIWFTNMLLLGFDPLAQEEKHKLPFNR